MYMHLVFLVTVSSDSQPILILLRIQPSTMGLFLHHRKCSQSGENVICIIFTQMLAEFRLHTQVHIQFRLTKNEEMDGT